MIVLELIDKMHVETEILDMFHLSTICLYPFSIVIISVVDITHPYSSS